MFVDPLSCTSPWGQLVGRALFPEYGGVLVATGWCKIAAEALVVSHEHETTQGRLWGRLSRGRGLEKDKHGNQRSRSSHLAVFPIRTQIIGGLISVGRETSLFFRLGEGKVMANLRVESRPPTPHPWRGGIPGLSRCAENNLSLRNKGQRLFA